MTHHTHSLKRRIAVVVGAALFAACSSESDTPEESTTTTTTTTTTTQPTVSPTEKAPAPTGTDGFTPPVRATQPTLVHPDED